jgi:hypothetical protein
VESGIPGAGPQARKIHTFEGDKAKKEGKKVDKRKESLKA